MLNVVDFPTLGSPTTPALTWVDGRPRITRSLTSSFCAPKSERAGGRPVSGGSARIYFRGVVRGGPVAQAAGRAPSSAASQAATEPLSNARHLDHMTTVEFYELYCALCTGQPSSKTTFVRAIIAGNWHLKILFRPLCGPNDLPKCATCIKIKEWGRQILSETDRVNLQNFKTEHCNEIMLWQLGRIR